MIVLLGIFVLDVFLLLIIRTNLSYKSGFCFDLLLLRLRCGRRVDHLAMAPFAWMSFCTLRGLFVVLGIFGNLVVLERVWVGCLEGAGLGFFLAVASRGFLSPVGGFGRRGFAGLFGRSGGLCFLGFGEVGDGLDLLDSLLNCYRRALFDEGIRLAEFVLVGYNKSASS